jgi:hypothetical protein
MTHRNACHQVKPALIMEEAMTKVFKLKLSAIQNETCHVSDLDLLHDLEVNVRNSSGSMSCVRVGREEDPRWSRRVVVPKVPLGEVPLASSRMLMLCPCY